MTIMLQVRVESNSKEWSPADILNAVQKQLDVSNDVALDETVIEVSLMTEGRWMELGKEGR